MPPHYQQIKNNLIKTIGNHLAALTQSRTKRDKTICGKMMFDYIISEKQNVFDINIMDARFISTMKNKLIEFHNQNIPWAYNYYLILFDEIMPVINEIVIEDDIPIENQNILDEIINENDVLINPNIIHFNDDDDDDDDDEDEKDDDDDIFYNR